MNKTWIFVIIAEIWMTIGQLCFKKSADRLDIQDTTPLVWMAQLLKCLFQYPLLWTGTLAMLAGLLFWLAALNSGNLNFVYLLGSIQYIFALFAAHLFLQEKINRPKVIGTLLITLGIILTAIS